MTRTPLVKLALGGGMLSAALAFTVIDLASGTWPPEHGVASLGLFLAALLAFLGV